MTHHFKHTRLYKTKTIYFAHGVCTLITYWLYLLLLEAQYQPVIQNIFLWLPSAVPKQGCSNMKKSHNKRKHFTTRSGINLHFCEDIKNNNNNNADMCLTLTTVVNFDLREGLTSSPILSISPGIQVVPA